MSSQLPGKAFWHRSSSQTPQIWISSRSTEVQNSWPKFDVTFPLPWKPTSPSKFTSSRASEELLTRVVRHRAASDVISFPSLLLMFLRLSLYPFSVPCHSLQSVPCPCLSDFLRFNFPSGKLWLLKVKSVNFRHGVRRNIPADSHHQNYLPAVLCFGCNRCHLE